LCFRLVYPLHELAEGRAESALVRPLGSRAGERGKVSAIRADDVIERLEDASMVRGEGRGPRVGKLLGSKPGTERDELACRPGVVSKCFFERGVDLAHWAEW